MRWQRLGLVVFLAAGVVAGTWVVTDTPEPAQTLRVEAPASQPPEAPPPNALTVDELILRLTDGVAGRALCEAPPTELPEELKRVFEQAFATIPPPPGFNPDAAPEVINIHRRMVPC